jgi:hypothetical protein
MKYKGKEYRSIHGLKIEKGDLVFDGDKMTKVSIGSVGHYAIIDCFYRAVKHKKKTVKK